MGEIRFFHVADVHLDSPFKGVYGLSEQAAAELRESTFVAFERIITYALEVKPDFILLVGDLYDGENRSLKAQRRFQESMERLFEANIPVVLSYGNHDHLSGQWTRFSLPSNVIVLPQETSVVQLKIRGQEVKIYGFSYPERHVKEPVIQTYPVAEDHSTLHIGMLHGSVAGDSAHAVYAPFTKEELLSKGYDYWALGHIHLRQHLHENPPIVYPGNIQSRHRNEQGVKGFYDVQLLKGQAVLNFVRTSAIVYEMIEVDCTGFVHANELLAACEEAIEECRMRVGALVADLKLISRDQESQELIESASIKGWLDAVREVETMRHPFTWVQSLTIETKRLEEYVPTAVTESVLAVLDEWRQADWKDVLKDLYQHTSSSRFLDHLSLQDIEQMKKEAQQLFKNEMSKQG